MTDLHQHLSQLSTHPNARLVVQTDHAWVVLNSFSPPNRVLFEISSNRYLPKENHLSEAQLKQLEGWGYTKRKAGRSIGAITYLTTDDDIQRVASDIHKIFAEIFHQEGSALTCAFTQNTKHDLSNRKLHNTMRETASSKEHNRRIALYQELINSQLLAYVSADSDNFFPYDTIGPFVTFAAFTEDKYLKQFDPRGCPVKQMYAFELLPKLLEQNAGSLILNPKCDIRGELYRNELQSIVKALRLPKS